MPIANRDLDVSQQKVVVEFNKQVLTAVSATLFVAVVPWPSKIKAARIAGGGLSGAPVHNINVHRWTSAGLTVFDPLGTAATLAGDYGLSGGSVAWSVTTGPVALLADDVLVIKTSTANTASLWLAASIVLQKTQDIVSDFGSST